MRVLDDANNLSLVAVGIVLKLPPHDPGLVQFRL